MPLSLGAWFVTYSARLNLSGMRRNILLLVLAFISIAAASGAEGNSNHLRGQKSSYLKRAVFQPVDWYPWGAEVFQRAKDLDNHSGRIPFSSGINSVLLQL